MAGPFEYLFNAKAAPNDPTSYQALEARRKIALQMLANSGRKGYPKTFGEGLTAVGDAIGDVGQMNQLAQMEATWGKQAAARAAAASGDDSAPPSTPPPTVPQTTSENTAADKPVVASSYAPEDTGDVQAVKMVNTAATPAVATAEPAEVEPGVSGAGFNPLDATAGADPWLAHRKALAAIETGGEKDPYTALGKVIPKTGDRAYGMYQIMGANIPSWTQAATGQALTPQQFLASPAAQEATAKHRFTGYVNKYGDEGAARAWYAGEHGMDKLDHTDVHERLSVRDYGRDFMNRMAPYNRDRVAAAGTPQPDTQPPAALPLSATADQPTDLPSEITRGFSATPQAAAQIHTAPPIRMAQATPNLPPSIKPPAAPAEPVPSSTPFSSIPQLAPKSPLRLRNEKALIEAQMVGDPNAEAYRSAIATDETARQEKYKNALEAWQREPERRAAADAAQQRAYQENITRRLGGVAPATFEKNLATGQEAVAGIPAATQSIKRARDLLVNDKMFTGLGADVDTYLAKAMGSAGFPIDPRASGTEQFKTAMAGVLAQARKGIIGPGSQSDRELETLQKSTAADAKLTPETIKATLDAAERLNLHMALNHQKQVRLYAFEDDPDRQRQVYGAYGIPSATMTDLVPQASVNKLFQYARDPQKLKDFDDTYHTPGLSRDVLRFRKPQ